MIAAIILAAGLSSRTKGSNKLLLNYKGKKIIKQVQVKFGITLEWEIKIIGI